MGRIVLSARYRYYAGQRRIKMKMEEEIRIISGEGDVGTVERYSGKHSERAIKLKLTRERCNGDRWAKAVQFSHVNADGQVGIDLETGEYCNFPAIQD
jgi:hypothetical protein